MPHLFGATAFREASLPVATAVWLAERPIAWVYRRSEFQAISESTRDELAARGVDPARIRVIYPGVDADWFCPDEKAARADVPTFLYVGRLKRYKGIEFALRAMHTLRDTIPNAVLQIAGDGDDRERERARGPGGCAPLGASMVVLGDGRCCGCGGGPCPRYGRARDMDRARVAPHAVGLRIRPRAPGTRQLRFGGASSRTRIGQRFPVLGRVSIVSSVDAPSTARRLAAIVVLDVVGYSRMMAEDDDGTYAAFVAHRNAIDPILLNHGCRIVKGTADARRGGPSHGSRRG